MGASRNIHFTGSIGLEDEVAVFKALGRAVGARAKRYPDGETGVRAGWIRWVTELLNNHPSLMLQGSENRPGENAPVALPVFTYADGAGPNDLHFDTLGYAAPAIASYAGFSELKAASDIPAEVRFQVSLPTAVALTTTFSEMSIRDEFEAAVEAGLRRDVEKITATIPADQLAIQWDVAHEVIAHDGASGPWAVHYGDKLAGAVERICRQLDYVPSNVQAGVHLCYGDPGHKHIVEPEDLSTCVAFTNGIVAGTSRPVDWVHMPVPRGRSDDAYFAPLTGLDCAGTEIFLGLVHYTDGVDGTRARVATAEKHLGAFGIATECGFGRRPADTIPALLDIHTEVADA